MSVSEASCMLVLQENCGEKLTQIPRTGQGRIQEAKIEATSYLNKHKNRKSSKANNNDRNNNHVAGGEHSICLNAMEIHLKFL